MRLEYQVLQFLPFSILCQIAFTHAQSQPTVTINNGTIMGTQNSQYIQDFFLGIPYAQPPLGNLRFALPQPINQSWSEKRAITYGLWCHSSPLSLPGFTQTGFDHDESEDCLTLNVVRPSGANASDAHLPVLVWIHGGGLREGGSADQRYNMSFLVQESVRMGQPTIGVSFNYRLSGFGFLQGRAVNESGVANLGLYDQRLALHWIQENILAFGGNPHRVTIQGESSGAVSVGHHFLAYGGRDDGLFHAGIAESGGPLTTSALISLDQQDILYNNVLNATNCIGEEDTLQCLRSKSADTLKAAFQGVNYYPVMDGGIITGFPSIALKEGKFVKRPLLIGTNTNEGAAFSIGSARGVNNSADFQAMIAQFSGGNGPENTTIDALADQYLRRLSPEEAQSDLETVLLSPSPEYGSLYGKVTLYAGDFMFSAGRRYTTQLWARYGVPAYSYRFDAVPNGIPSKTLGATHFQVSPLRVQEFRWRRLSDQSLSIGHRRITAKISRFEQFYEPNVVELRQHTIAECSSRQVDICPRNMLPGYFADLEKGNVTWPVYRNENGANIVFRLNCTHLEPDTWRSNAVGSLVSSLHEFKI